MLEKLMGNPIAWAILAAFTILSVAFSVYTWLAGKKRKKISYFIKSSTLIKNGSSQIKNLTILYNNREIDDLSVSQFYIWNSGNDVIRSADIDGLKQLCISNTDSATILEASILFSNDDSNKIKISNEDNGNIHICFDFLEAGDGTHIQVIHSGNANNLKVDCKIIGGEKICNASDNEKYNQTKSKWKIYFSKVIQIVLSYLICIGAAFAVTFALKHRLSSTTLMIIETAVVIIAGFVGVIIGTRISRSVKKHYGLLIPSTLLKHNKKE